MRNRLAPTLAGVALAILVAGGSALAHHAFSAEFDATKPVALRGTITKMEWINPHAWMHIDVTNEDGSVDAWMIEAGPSRSLGASRMAPGFGHPRHRGARRGLPGDRRCVPGQRP